MYPIMNQSNNRRCLGRFQTHKHKHTQSDGCTAEQCDCDERALLTRLRFRFARLPVTAPGQQVEQQSDQRHDQQRSWYRRQNSQTLFVCVCGNEIQMFRVTKIKTKANIVHVERITGSRCFGPHTHQHPCYWYEKAGNTWSMRMQYACVCGGSK